MTQPDTRRILENLRAQAVNGRDDARLLVFGDLHDAELRACNFKGAGAAGVRAAAPHGLFVAESPHAIRRALFAGMQPFAALVDETVAEGDPAVLRAAGELLDMWPQTPLFLVGTADFRRITEYPVSRGIMIAFARPEPRDATALLHDLDAAGAGRRRVCVIEDVTNYANMAAIFEAAAAFRIDAVLITPSCHDPWYRRAIRVSEGAVFEVPWAYAGARGAPSEQEPDGHWSARGIPLLHDAGYTVVALALEEDAIPLDDERLRTCGKLALVLGTEGEGLDARTIAACDHTVIIPMSHDVDSLNVAAASAVAFWELC